MVDLDEVFTKRSRPHIKKFQFWLSRFLTRSLYNDFDPNTQFSWTFRQGLTKKLNFHWRSDLVYIVDLIKNVINFVE